MLAAMQRKLGLMVRISSERIAVFERQRSSMSSLILQRKQWDEMVSQ